MYQGSEPHHFSDTSTKSCRDQALSDICSLDKNMRARLEWSNVEILSSILLLLDTQSWLTTEHTEETSRMTEIKSAAPNSLTDVFRAPLEGKGVDLSLTVDEIGDIVDYART